MTAPKEELMSISSNSISISDEHEIRPEKNKPKKLSRGTVRYKLQVAHVPKRIFQQIQRRLKRNKPIVPVKNQTLEQTSCSRFMLGQIDGNEMDTVSLESTTRLIWEMRECLQRKEYGDLAKLISAFTEMPTGKMRWYPTLIKYCLIVLMYDPLVQGTELMDMFLDGVMGCRSEADKKEFLKEISQLPSNIHVTKYDDLWTEYPLPNQLNKDTVDQLCQNLNQRINIKTEDAHSDSEWETYDENSSDEDNDEETTEPEKTFDFTDAINRLQKSITK